MDYAQTTTIVSIVVITTLCGKVVKSFTKIDNSKIPPIVGIVGGLLGIVAMHVIPDFPANNVLDAVAIGITSGFASTGLHQAVTRAISK